MAFHLREKGGESIGLGSGYIFAVSPQKTTVAMNQQIDSLKTLKAARYKLVQERRGLAIAIALGHRRRRTDNPQTNEMRETFVFIQNTIEAIERAIAHEQLIVDEPVETFALPNLELGPALAAPDEAALTALAKTGGAANCQNTKTAQATTSLNIAQELP